MSKTFRAWKIDEPLLSQGVAIATLIFRYFLRYFSSTHRTDLSRFRGTFHRFDPVGFAIFDIPSNLARASGLSPKMPISDEIKRCDPVMQTISSSASIM